jgi:hypothetical protein
MHRRPFDSIIPSGKKVTTLSLDTGSKTPLPSPGSARISVSAQVPSTPERTGADESSSSLHPLKISNAIIDKKKVFIAAYYSSLAIEKRNVELVIYDEVMVKESSCTLECRSSSNSYKMG